MGNGHGHQSHNGGNFDVISQEDAQKFLGIDSLSSGGKYSLQKNKSIEDFTALKHLFCLNNQLTSLNLKSNLNVGRYHSWIVDSPIPHEFKITSIDENGEIMSIKHKDFNVRGVQFHPEYKSTVASPHPLFVSFVKAANEHLKNN